MDVISEKEAIAILRKYAPNEEIFNKVLSHSLKVKEIAMRNAQKIMDNGYFVDLDLIASGSILHDIGRFKCPPNSSLSIRHGVVGAEILIKEKLPQEALIAARHIGAGITKEEIKEQNLDLAPEDYVPESYEEKIIADADNVVFGDREGTIEEAIERYKKEVGIGAAEKIKQLHEEILELQNG